MLAGVGYNRGRTEEDKMQNQLTNSEAPMLAIAAQSVAVAVAKANGSLAINREFNNRLGVEYWAVSDDAGLIEVFNSFDEAKSFAGI